MWLWAFTKPGNVSGWVIPPERRLLAPPVLEPDSTRAVPTHAGTPGGLDNPHALEILSTEHWSLLSARSLGYTEAMSRASVYIAALSGSVIALALVGQVTDFGTGFVAFALVLLPVVYLLGLSTRPWRSSGCGRGARLRSTSRSSSSGSLRPTAAPSSGPARTILTPWPPRPPFRHRSRRSRTR